MLFAFSLLCVLRSPPIVSDRTFDPGRNRYQEKFYERPPEEQDGFGIAKKKKLPYLVCCHVVMAEREAQRKDEEQKELIHNIRITRRVAKKRLMTLQGSAQLREMVRQKVLNQKAHTRECSDALKEADAQLNLKKKKHDETEERVSQVRPLLLPSLSSTPEHDPLPSPPLHRASLLSAIPSFSPSLLSPPTPSLKFKKGFAVAMHRIESTAQAGALTSAAKAALEEAATAHAAAKETFEHASLKRTDAEWTTLCHDEVVAEAVAEERLRVIIVLRTLARLRGERRPWDGVDGADFIEWSTKNPAHRMEQKTEALLMSELVCEAEEADAGGAIVKAATKQEIELDIAREKAKNALKKTQKAISNLL
jgi:hypothetical protein